MKQGTKRCLVVLVASAIAMAGTSCSDEFAGGSTKFGGSAGKKKGSSNHNSDSPPDDIITDDQVQEPSADAEPALPGDEDGDGQTDDKETITIEETEQCISRDAGINPILNFEDLPPGMAGGTPRNMILSNQFEKSHGVRFSVTGGHTPVIRQTTGYGDLQLPASEEAWLCVLCEGTPSRNRIVDASAEATIGSFVLSSTAASKNAAGSLKVDYRIPVASLSFDLIDVDGDEIWVIEVIDTKGQIIPSMTQQISVSGYTIDRTGNGAPTHISVATADNSRSIMGFMIRGAKPVQKFGFAFDNFEPGIPDCDD